MTILTALALAVGLAPTPEQAWTTVGTFYAEVVKRHPLGLPEGATRRVLEPFLSARLRRRLFYAEACERDYARQQPKGSTDKPEYGWLEAGLFSGSNERALPQAAEVVHTEDEGERMVVYVQLTYVDRHPQFPVTDVWHRAVVLTAADGAWRIDDVRTLDDETLDDQGGIEEILGGCDRGRWIGYDAWKKRRR